MNNPKIEKMNAYLDQKIASCQEKTRALLADNRQDEADFEKVTANVYDIFRTMLSVGCGIHSSPEATGDFFRQKLDQIPTNWSNSLAKAQEHGNIAKAHIENLKLSAVNDIKKAFQLIWEENQ